MSVHIYLMYRVNLRPLNDFLSSKNRIKDQGSKASKKSDASLYSKTQCPWDFLIGEEVTTVVKVFI